MCSGTAAQEDEEATCLMTLLHSLGLLRNGINQLPGMVVEETLETRHYMRFCHMDVIPLRHAGRTVPHEAGQGELVHAALGAAGAKGVTPAVELEGLQSCIAYCFLVRMLNRHQMPRLTRTGENELRPFHQLPPSKQHFPRARR